MKRILLVLVILSVTFSCYQRLDQGEKPVISVSILPQEYFVQQLAGDLVEVNVLIPSGASPATYEPSVSQLRKLEQSVAYLRIGYVGFELSWMDKMQKVNPAMKVVDLSRGIDLITESEEPEPAHGHAHGGVDPHIWLSVPNARVIADNIHRELLLMFPDQQVELEGRYESFTSSLDSLHLAIKHTLNGLADRNFIVYHPALTYFARDYQLVQYSLEIEGKSPSPAHLRRITDLGKAHRITRIFIQDQFDRRNAEVLAREIGAEIVHFDPLDPCWMAQMLYIADQFKSTRP